jgi:hypothetical protein
MIRVGFRVRVGYQSVVRVRVRIRFGLVLQLAYFPLLLWTEGDFVLGVFDWGGLRGLYPTFPWSPHDTS